MNLKLLHRIWFYDHCQNFAAGNITLRIRIYLTFSGDGTCEGVVCDLNADCVSLNSIGGPQKECMCKSGFTGRGDICKGEVAIFYYYCYYYYYYCYCYYYFIAAVESDSCCFVQTRHKMSQSVALIPRTVFTIVYLRSGIIL